MDNESIIAIVCIVVAVAILIKFWRSILKLLLLGAVIVFGLTVANNAQLFSRIEPFLSKLFEKTTPKSSYEPPVVPVQPTKQRRPDLTVQLSSRPSVPFSCNNKRFSIVAHVGNSGEIAAHNIEVGYNNIGSKNVGSLAPGQSKRVNFSPQLPNFSGSSGMKTIRFIFIVDPYNKIEESNEGNNRSREFSVECF